MEAKKEPKADIRRYRGMFFNFGLAISLAIVLVAFEWKTMTVETSMVVVPDEEAITLEVPPVTVQPPPPKPVIPETIIEKPDEEVIEEQPEVVFNIEPDDFDPEDIDVIDEPVEEEVAPQVFITSEVEPEPVGGLQTFYKYLGKNIKYPKRARQFDVQGRVIVTFVVEKDGSLTDIKVLKGIGSGCDEEAVRVLAKAPNWKPGKQRGVPVKVRRTIPIIFNLNN